MQINKWRLFGLHYAILLVILVVWMFTFTNLYFINGKNIFFPWDLIGENFFIPWKSILLDLFAIKNAPVVNGLLLASISTYFYLYIFQDLIQKQFKRFAIRFCLFLGFLILLQILLWAFHDWLLFNYTYEHEKNQAWIETQRNNGNLFRPFFPLLLDSFIILFQNGLVVVGIDDIIFYLLYTAFFTLIMYVWQSRKREAELEKWQRETEIQTLKAQLNPHFLFNSLNTIYSSALTEKDTSTAQLVQQLSGILRHSVEEVQNEKTDIQKELAFIEKYIALQRARLPEHPNVSIQSTLFWDQEPADIAPLLLIPLIENAFQYGVSIDEPSFVHVDLRVEDRTLHLTVKNSITTRHTEKKGAGTGLKNSEKRLALLYPDRYSLHCDQQKDTFEIDLTLQL